MNFVEKTENRINEAIGILEAIGIPVQQMTTRRQRRVAMALLACANLTPSCKWSDANSWPRCAHNLTTRQIIEFWNANYGENISSGSYDDVRRKDLVYLVEAAVVIKSAGKSNSNTNNPTRGYAINGEAEHVLTSFGKRTWKTHVEQFRKQQGVLIDKINRERTFKKIDVKLPGGKKFKLSPGPHNTLQKQIVEEFLPRFVPGSELLYVGDSTKKKVVLNETRLQELGFFELARDALPDVVAYFPKKSWLILIEAVHTSNPIDQLRHLMLERMTAKCKAPRVYVSAFDGRRTFRN